MISQLKNYLYKFLQASGLMQIRHDFQLQKIFFATSKKKCYTIASYRIFQFQAAERRQSSAVAIIWNEGRVQCLCFMLGTELWLPSHCYNLAYILQLYNSIGPIHATLLSTMKKRTLLIKTSKNVHSIHPSLKKLSVQPYFLAPRCLKITEKKVSFNIASEASYVYILS